MQSIRNVAKLNALELEKVVPPNASWHTDYRDTAYIYIGGLPFELSEGDVLTIFSQYGNPVHINLVRDKETGKSKGFCFLKYEDQKSCDLAVDNLSGAKVLGRELSVDHTRYKRKDDETENNVLVEERGEVDTEVEEESEDEEEQRPLIREELELQKLLREHDDDDPMKGYMIEQKREEVKEALGKLKTKEKSGEKKDKHRRHQRTRRDGSEEKSRRDGHRSRRDRDDEERKERIPHRSRRDRSESSENDGKDSRKRRSHRDGSASDDERPPARRRRSRDDRSVSREPYRRR